MGLSFLSGSNIVPDISLKAPKRPSVKESRKTKEYYIVQLDLPQGMSAADQRQVLAFVEALLNEKQPDRIQPDSESNLSIAKRIVYQIKHQQN